MKVLEDIEADKIYDDVQVDFESVSKNCIKLITGMPSNQDFT
jgi:hypothetical protein